MCLCDPWGSRGIILYLDYQSVSPSPLSRKRVCPPPLGTQVLRQHSLAGEEGAPWGANSDDLRESLALWYSVREAKAVNLGTCGFWKYSEFWFSVIPANFYTTPTISHPWGSGKNVKEDGKKVFFKTVKHTKNARKGLFSAQALCWRPMTCV